MNINISTSEQYKYKDFLVHIRDFCLFGIHVICLKKKEKKRMNTEMFHTVTDSLQGMRN